jgi:hypothetical protein
VEGATALVAVVASRTEAELIVGMLRSHGLRTAVAANDAGGQESQLQLQGVRVLVFSADEASARQAPGGYAPSSLKLDSDRRPMKHKGKCLVDRTSLKERAGVKWCRPWVLVALRCLQGVVS